MPSFFPPFLFFSLLCAVNWIHHDPIQGSSPPSSETPQFLFPAVLFQMILIVIQSRWCQVTSLLLSWPVHVWTRVKLHFVINITVIYCKHTFSAAACMRKRWNFMTKKYDPILLSLAAQWWSDFIFHKTCLRQLKLPFTPSGTVLYKWYSSVKLLWFHNDSFTFKSSKCIKAKQKKNPTFFAWVESNERDFNKIMLLLHFPFSIKVLIHYFKNK